jgi:hypothetical protein
MAKIYHNEKVQSKICKGKKVLGWHMGEARQVLQESSPSEVSHDMLNSSNRAVTAWMLSLGFFIKDSVLRVLIEGWS